MKSKSLAYRFSPEAERHKLLVEWNATDADYPRDNASMNCSRRRAARTPEAIAVVQEDLRDHLCGAECESQSACPYTPGLGVKPGDYVPICLERALIGGGGTRDPEGGRRLCADRSRLIPLSGSPSW